MLQHEEKTEQTWTAANVRVTAEELAQAVAAVEGRKMEQGDTIRIGEAVQQLGLNVTPEELLAEVQAKRKVAAVKTEAIPTVTKRPRRQRLVRLVFIASLITNIMLGIQVANEPHHRFPTHTTASAGSLSDVLDNQPVYASLDTLYSLATGKPASKTEISNFVNNSDINNTQWQLIKLNGEVYVRGWRVKSGDFTVLSGKVTGHPNNFFSAQIASDATQLTVPISEFQKIKDPAYIRTDPEVDGMRQFGQKVEGVDLPSEAGAAR